MPAVAGEPLPKSKSGRGTRWPKPPAAFWVTSSTGASCNRNKTSRRVWLQLLWFGVGAIPLPMASVTVIFFLSTLWARLSLFNEVSMQPSFLEDVSFSGWKVCPGRTEEFDTLASWFSSPWLGEDVWASGNAEAVGKGLGSRTAPPCAPGTSQAGHAGAASQKPSGEYRGPSWVYGCRRSPSFLYRLAWYFFFPLHPPPFPFAPLRNRINQVYIGGSGFFPQHAAGKQTWY